MNTLAQGYQAALFDLDGVVYLGPVAVEGAAEGIAALKQQGTRVGFVTNNAARPPQVVVDQLTGLDVPAELSDVVTSAQAGARMLKEQLPAGSRVLVVGSQALADEVTAVGMEPVWSSEDQPAAVIQGYDPQMVWPRLDDACFAIQAGATWFVTNTDSTRPTDKGLVPGAGAQIAAVQGAVRQTPQAAGKPSPPLLLETLRRLGTTNREAIFVGDRLDTDVKGAVAVGMDSLFVFTGAHGKADLVAAGVDSRPTCIGYDLRALLDEPRIAELDQTGATCRAQRAEVRDGRVVLDQVPEDRESQLDALWALLQLVWRDPSLDASVVEQLSRVP